MVTRRNFIAAVAATSAAPTHMLAAPVGGALRVPANFTKGKAIPEGFDFRDPFSGLFMSFSLWYVVGESGLAEVEQGYPTPEAAYAAYLDKELADYETLLSSLMARKATGDLLDHEARDYDRLIGSYLRRVADITDEKQKQVVPSYFTEDPEQADLGVRMEENYMGAAVVRGDMTYEFVRRYATDESYGGSPEAVEDIERAQNDPEWGMNWGGGC